MCTWKTVFEACMEAENKMGSCITSVAFFLPVEHPVNGPESTVQCKRKFYVSEFCRD